MRLAKMPAWIAMLVAALALGCSDAPSDANDPGDATGEPPPAGSFADALTEVDPLERAYRIAASLQHFGPDDLDAALRALDDHSTGVTPEEVRLLMLGWARFDAPGAFEWARTYPGGWRNRLMDQAAYAWGYQDGPAALAAIEALDDEELVTRLRPSVMEGWLRSDDKEAATRFVAAVDDPRRRRRLTFTLAAENLRGGVDALVAWAEAVPEDAPNRFKQSAFYHASTMVTGMDPQRARSWYEAHRGDWYSEGSLPGIARRWVAGHDPEQLFAWLLELEPAPGRGDEVSEAVRFGFRNWMQKAPQEAEAWLREAPADPRLSAARVEAARALAPTAPERAVAWLPRIEDETERRRATIRVGRMWWAREPEAAKAWLEASDLPEQVRRQIQAQPRALVRRKAPAADRTEATTDPEETALP